MLGFSIVDSEKIEIFLIFIIFYYVITLVY